jgi:putative membrane protein
MDATTEAFLKSWEWRWDVIFVLLTVTLFYVTGWVRLRQRGAKIANTWRLAAYLAGMGFIALALLSGIGTFESLLFFIHMIQHILMMMYAAPLIMLASPFTIGVWGLPRPVRLRLARFLNQKSLLRQVIVRVTKPGIVWMFYTLNLWMWHDPEMYERATTQSTIHNLQHLLFFFTALAIWWHTTDAAPKFHKRRTYGKRIMFAAGTYFQNLLLGIWITMSPELIYTYYATVPRLWGLEAHRDQVIGGLIMWIPGGMMYGYTILILISRMMDYSERQAEIKAEKARLQRQRAKGIVPS